MNGKKAKQLRKIVAMSGVADAEVSYEVIKHNPKMVHGEFTQPITIKLSKTCQRHFYQDAKKMWKRYKISYR